jgi:hypothetical protein
VGWKASSQTYTVLLLVGLLPSNTVTRTVWHERVLVWAAAMINNTVCPTEPPSTSNPLWMSWGGGTQSLSRYGSALPLIRRDTNHPLSYHTRFTHTSPPSSKAPRGAAGWRNVARDTVRRHMSGWCGCLYWRTLVRRLSWFLICPRLHKHLYFQVHIIKCDHQHIVYSRTVMAHLII